MRLLRTAALALPLALLPVLSACDAVEEATGLDDVDVNLGNVGTLAVFPDGITRSGGTVDLPSIPGSPEVDDITISEDNVTFTSDAENRGASAGPCSFPYWLLINDVPAIDGTVQVNAADEVTDISVQYPSQYTEDDIADICAGYGEDDCPVETVFSTGQIDSHVEGAINGDQLTVDIIVHNPNDCSGTLNISEVRFDFGL